MCEVILANCPPCCVLEKGHHLSLIWELLIHLMYKVVT